MRSRNGTKLFTHGTRIKITVVRDRTPTDDVFGPAVRTIDVVVFYRLKTCGLSSSRRTNGDARERFTFVEQWACRPFKYTNGPRDSCSVQCRQLRVTFRALQSFSALTYGCEYGTAIEHRVQVVPFRLRVGFVGDERFVFPDEVLGFRQRRRIVVGESFAHHLQTSKRRLFFCTRNSFPGKQMGFRSIFLTFSSLPRNQTRPILS